MSCIASFVLLSLEIGLDFVQGMDQEFGRSRFCLGMGVPFEGGHFARGCISNFIIVGGAIDCLSS